VIALTIRVALSVTIFLLVIAGFLMGWLPRQMTPLKSGRIQTKGRTITCGLFYRPARQLDEYVDEKEQSQPDHVDEMPVPGNRFKTEMMIRFEMALDAAEQNHRQHDGTPRDVKSVESGQHEEGRTKIRPTST